MNGALGGAAAAGTKVPGGGLWVKRDDAAAADGLGRFKCDLALIHMVHEAKSATNKMTNRMPNAKANLEGDKQSKSSSIVIVLPDA